MHPSILRLLSRTTLDHLLSLRFESEVLDYKASLDLESQYGRTELARDALAMANTNGGFIVVGVEDKTFRIVGLPANQVEKLKEGSSINKALEKLLQNQLIVHSALHHVETPENVEPVPIALLFIPPADQMLPAPVDGNYAGQNGKGTEQLFRQGEILVRRADTSTRAKSTAELQRPKIDFEKHFQDLLSLSGSQQVRQSEVPFDNPYNTSIVARENMFKGRDEEISRLVQSIAGGNHVTLYGLQRVGKTSLVQHLFADSCGSFPQLKGVALATVNLQELGSESVTQRDLIDMMVASICSALESDGGECEARNAFAGYIENAGFRAGDRTSLFRAFKAAVETILASSPGRVVLFLDEFSELCKAIENNNLLASKSSYRVEKLRSDEMYVDIPFLKRFSDLMKSPTLYRKLTFIFAARPFVAEYDGSRGMQVLKLTKSIPLYYLTEVASKELIRDPVRGLLRMGEDAVDYLYRLTAGHPYFIQFMMQEAVDVALIKGRRTISLDDIKRLEGEMVSQGAPYLSHFNLLDSDYSVEEINNQGTRDLGRGTLAIISRMGTERPEGWVEEREVKKTLARFGVLERSASSILSELRHAEIIKEVRAEGYLYVRVAVPLLRKRYVTQNYYQQYFPGQPSAGKTGR